MRMVTPLYYTAEMVRALPEDGQRYETVHGELLVSPAPRAWHQEVLVRLLVALHRYVTEEAVGHLFASPADISWAPDVLVQPDLFVVPLSEARTMDWREIRSLLLAVEILSPSSIQADRFTKRRLYQEVGIPAYWVVDADQRFVEVWTPDALFPVIHDRALQWQPAGASRPLILDLEELFRPL
jgi:Uma2 family endonuclease